MDSATYWSELEAELEERTTAVASEAAAEDEAARERRLTQYMQEVWSDVSRRVAELTAKLAAGG